MTNCPSRVPFLCVASFTVGVSALPPLQRIATGAVFHFPSVGVKLRTQAIGLDPVLLPARHTAGFGERLDVIGNDLGFRLPFREPEPEYAVEGKQRRVLDGALIV